MKNIIAGILLIILIMSLGGNVYQYISNSKYQTKLDEVIEQQQKISGEIEEKEKEIILAEEKCKSVEEEIENLTPKKDALEKEVETEAKIQKEQSMRWLAEEIILDYFGQ